MDSEVTSAIQKLQTEAWRTAEDNGWHAEDRSPPELLCLIHSEVSEALEEYRDRRAPDELYYDPKSNPPNKPEGIPAELADVIIRILDLCGTYNIDLAAALKVKMDYNKIRPYRHGGKIL